MSAVASFRVAGGTTSQEVEVADDVRKDDDKPDEQPQASYEKPEVEDLESGDGPVATAALLSNGTAQPG